MPSTIRGGEAGSRISHTSSRSVRWLGFLACGVLVQTATASCNGQFLSSLQQAISKGVDEGITNLMQALVLNLFA